MCSHRHHSQVLNLPFIQYMISPRENQVHLANDMAVWNLALLSQIAEQEFSDPLLDHILSHDRSCIRYNIGHNLFYSMPSYHILHHLVTKTPGGQFHYEEHVSVCLLSASVNTYQRHTKHGNMGLFHLYSYGFIQTWQTRMEAFIMSIRHFSEEYEKFKRVDCLSLDCSWNSNMLHSMQNKG